MPLYCTNPKPPGLHTIKSLCNDCSSCFYFDKGILRLTIHGKLSIIQHTFQYLECHTSYQLLSISQLKLCDRSKTWHINLTVLTMPTTCHFNIQNKQKNCFLSPYLSYVFYTLPWISLQKGYYFTFCTSFFSCKAINQFTSPNWVYFYNLCSP